MDEILKAFLPEIYFSLIIFSQLLFNTRFVNELNFNYPLIIKEIISQNFFLFVGMIFILTNAKITGFFYNLLFLNDFGSVSLKILLICFCIPVLFLIGRGAFIQNINFFEYFTLFLLSILSLFLLLNTADILSAYLVIEMQALCFYILASFKRNSSFSTEAGLKYFIAGSFISGIFLIGASLIYGCLGTLQFNTIFILLSFPLTQTLEPIYFLVLGGVILITITIFFKIAAAPFHFWAPDVYEGAPLASTIVFSILPKISIFVFLIRWIFTLSIINLDINFIFIFVGILSVFFGTFFALKQKRLKRILIYSSIAQVGFLLVPFFGSSIDGLTSVIFYLLLYLITSILVWSNLILFYDCVKQFKRFSLNSLTTFFISNLAGLGKVNKINALTFIIVFFSISGIPPLGGFLAKVFIFLDLLDFKQFLGAFLLMFFNIISVYYYIRIIKIIFFEIKILNSVNLEFQMTFKTYLHENLYFIIASLLFALIFIFFFPTYFYLVAQYSILSFENF